MSKQALPGRRINAFAMDPCDLKIVGIDTDHGKGDHPLWDERNDYPVSESLVLNIMVYGVTHAVTVRKEGGDPIVVDGRQRVRAAREANKRLLAEGKEAMTIPVLPKRGSDETMFGVMISANENRQDDSILVKADKAGRLRDMGKSVKEVAIAFGVTEQAVHTWLSLLDVCGEVRKAVEKGTISASVAAKLAPLGREDQVKEMKEMVESGTATTAQASARVRTKRTGKETNAAPGKRTIKKLVEYVRTLEEEPLSEDFIRALRWAVGDLATTSIGGLTALINESKAQ